MKNLLYILVVSLCILTACVSPPGKPVITGQVPPPSQPPEEQVPQEEPVPEEPLPEETHAEAMPEVPKTGGLVLTFLDTGGGNPVTVNYRLYSPERADSPVAEDRGSSAALTLEAGNYTLLVSWETGARRFDGISVTADRLNERPVILEAGTLNLRFLDLPGGELSEAPYTLYNHGDTDIPVCEDLRADPSLLLSEGLYDLCVGKEPDDAWSYGLSITAGGISEYTVILSKSTLNLRFTDPLTGTPAWAEYRVYPAGKWEDILIWEDGDEFTAYLDSGTYDIYYAWEDGEGWIKELTTAEGSLITKEILLK